MPDVYQKRARVRSGKCADVIFPRVPALNRQSKECIRHTLAHTRTHSPDRAHTYEMPTLFGGMCGIRELRVRVRVDRVR